ncbi:hypothetical protein LAZ67_1003139 [Cordylochernes scorpioides]|uniref:Calx-beta domain-containing protein n=1 Tax=Cordylochernes scorpioides TaxID=51811 RepID=A0ABY6JY86_9ARAC|nr:hypothetical protein LAZ67_1003139 [Cordylochernes scorpioides]
MCQVFGVTAFFSIFAYIWLLIILMWISPNVVETWEAALTFLFFPLLVFLSYITDKNWCAGKGKLKDKQLELESASGSTGPHVHWNGGIYDDEDDMKKKGYFPGGSLDKGNLINFIKEIRKHPGLSEEDAACLAAARLMEERHHTRLWYRVGAVRSLTGGRKPKPRLSQKLREQCEEQVRALMAIVEGSENKVYDTILSDEEGKKLQTVAPDERKDIAIVEFQAATCAVMENAGHVEVVVRRHGKLTGAACCRVETIDGTAVSGEDYVAFRELITFEANQVEKRFKVEIVNDNQWEPDETFFLKMTIPEENVTDTALGRTCIMEITILNDDERERDGQSEVVCSEPGFLQFKRRGLLVRESIGTAAVPVIRKQGADGVVSAKWRTIDKTAVAGRDYKGGEGIITFEHGEIEKTIDIPIIDDFDAEKDEHFELELFEPQGGATIGQINRTTVTITNDDDFNSIMGRLMVMTNVNIDALKLQSETWAGQMRDAMNVNGGDLENATLMDYILHLVTFGWKIDSMSGWLQILFSLVPPTSILGGWVTFFMSLLVIGLLTAIVGDLASIFGCLAGLKDTVTAITFVALGTSLPDLFASRAAAMQEKYADNAIGNVTGSNSVNVFLGLGLPWLMASIFWESQGKTFKVHAGTLGFSVGIYTGCSLVCVALLLARRCMRVFGRGELGGPIPWARLTAFIMVGLWMLYILLSSLEAYGHI